ncbi:MAG: hypothetical protein GX621_09625 [Pirellulaceae bacterium]|nr:hypothetical protein [Pirellulaceae bacterium]
MQRFFRKALIPPTVLLLLAWLPASRADEISRKHHPWAMFAPEAWRETRVFNEVFDKEGKVVDTGVTETTTTLQSVDESGVTLCVGESVWMIGKWLDRRQETIKQNFHGDAVGQKITAKELDPETLVIEGRKISCQVRELRLADPKTQRLQVSKLYYNNDLDPFILKRETTLSDPADETVLSETVMVVDALRMPFLVGEQIISVAHLRATTKHARGTTITLAYTSTEVPGGIVCQHTKEMDKEGRLVGRRVLELSDYGLEPPADKVRRRGFPRRSREPRLRSTQTDAIESPGLLPPPASS